MGGSYGSSSGKFSRMISGIQWANLSTISHETVMWQIRNRTFSPTKIWIWFITNHPTRIFWAFFWENNGICRVRVGAQISWGVKKNSTSWTMVIGKMMKNSWWNGVQYPFTDNPMIPNTQKGFSMVDPRYYNLWMNTLKHVLLNVNIQ